MLKRLHSNQPGFEAALSALESETSLFDPVIEERARGILEDVGRRGDAAVLALTERFDGAQLTPDRLAVSAAERMAASLSASEALRAAVKATDRNVAGFSRKSRRRSWHSTNLEGARVGEKYDPFQRVGIYVPGGTAPLVSTALMTITLARVAGCPEIVVCTPCGKDGALNPALLFAVASAGATEIYRVGGAQAIAAMALGTPTIRRVQKIFGPGNAYVVAAKRLLFGRVAVDLLPGPSEVLILADETADPEFVAADLLAQAEHGSGHERVWLVTPVARLVGRVESAMKRQLKGLTRKVFIERALAAGGLAMVTRSMDEAVRVANRLAPEHCEIHARNPSVLGERVQTAGAIFLGAYSPTVTGDYVAGPSHTLPTGGAGRSFAGLTVDQFQRRTSVVEYTSRALRRSIDTITTFAEMEGLDAHGRSAAIRFSQTAGRRR